MTVIRNALVVSTSASALLCGVAPICVWAADGNGATTAADAVTDAGADNAAIVVTGVRGTKPRTVADSPVPIDVIGGQELQSTGRTGLKDMICPHQVARVDCC